ncbi:major facilitator superfamily domain-containing protein [Mycena rosella]|uniref:Major facilitator superfamily domain-containing protein n=1 Tax=Mycena rosella TaxID=1033263 RepID=A0AAD7E1J8_MYCRO|nr:major facilitator superfamily domain-containing protein [Mycena rosella]
MQVLWLTGGTGSSRLDSRLVDRRLLPLMSCLYAVALMDRSNLSVYLVPSILASPLPHSLIDLHDLTISNRYSTVSCLYFVPYTFCELSLSSGCFRDSTNQRSSQLPSNICLRFFGVRVWLTICVLGSGAVQLGMGFVKNWGQLALCRVLLGLFEAGFFPSIPMISICFLTGLFRLAVFYLTSIVIRGFNLNGIALPGYAITFLKGKADLNSWNWIFICQGILTVVLAILNYLFIADFPARHVPHDKVDERLVFSRVEADRGDSLADDITLSKVLPHLSDWTTWACALMFMSATMPAYAIAYFVTIILNSIGWDVRASLLLTTPPYVFAAVSCFLFAWISDRTKRRAPLIALQALLTLIGLSVTGYAKQTGARYLDLFLANAGASGCIPTVLAYVSGYNAACLFLMNEIELRQRGGIQIFREQDFPRYLNGIWATIGCQFLMLALLGITSWTLCTETGARERESSMARWKGCRVSSTLFDPS